MADKKNISDLTDHLGYWMRLVSNSVSQEFARKLNSKDVTVAEWVILRKLFDSTDTTSSSYIVELTGLTKGAVSKLIERLIQKDFVIKKESKTDRRFHEISLTARARKLVPQLAALADQNDYEFFSSLNQKEKKKMKEILLKIAQTKNLKKSPIE